MKILSDRLTAIHFQSASAVSSISPNKYSTEIPLNKLIQFFLIEFHNFSQQMEDILNQFETDSITQKLVKEFALICAIIQGQENIIREKEKINFEKENKLGEIKEKIRNLAEEFQYPFNSFDDFDSFLRFLSGFSSIVDEFNQNLKQLSLFSLKKILFTKTLFH
jgi:hypothetical protein